MTDTITKEFWESVLDYDTEITSVFIEESQLTQDIKNIKDKSNKIIADFGCGCGNALPFIKEFKHIYAIDFSQKLLEQTHNNISTLGLKNVEVIEHDIKQDIQLNQKCDVILAISSIFPNNIPEFYSQMNILIQNCKKGGEILMTVSSLESRTFSFMIDADILFHKKHNPQQIFQTIRNNELHQGLSSFGYLKTNKGIVQKHWMKEEIEFRLKEFNFEKIEVHKFPLHWETQLKNKDAKHYPNLWLWYVKIKI